MSEVLDLPLLLEPNELEQQLGQTPSLLIIDLSSREHYLGGHIPGAIHVPPAYTQLGQPPAPGLLPTQDQLQHLMRAIGLTPERHVVVYDDEGGGWAGRFIWLLDCIGHKRYSYLNGGLIAWINEGHPASKEIQAPVPSQYTVTTHSDPTITLNELLEIYNQSNVVIWDARSEDEYMGRRSGAIRPGRIPGAVHFEWTQGMDPARNYRIKDFNVLRETLKKLGIDAEKRVITHCQTHHRSGFTYLVGKLLGLNIQAYAGSWAEWGNHPETPIE